MQEQKINVQLNPGQDQLTITMLEGKAPVRLDEKAPIKTDIKGTLGAVREYLEKRVQTGQFKQTDCHILVNRDRASILLVINEDDAYARGEVFGQIQMNPKFEEFGINCKDSVWTPQQLGMFAKMNRAYFPDKASNMSLVSTLMHFTATVNNAVCAAGGILGEANGDNKVKTDNSMKPFEFRTVNNEIQSSVAQNGNNTENFAQVVNSNLPATFQIRIPVIKGGKAWDIDVETFASISGKEIRFILISPDAAALLEEVKANAIDDELKVIRELAPEIAIIEV